MPAQRNFTTGRELSDFCSPDKMALIVYDMQVGICHQVPCGKAITSKITTILDAARAGGFPVIFMRHMSMPRELMGGFQLRQAMAWQRTDDPDAVKPWFLRGSPGFELVPELNPQPNEAILDKITFSAFEGTPLQIILRDLGIVSFAICGIALEIGIDPTVRHGSDLGLVPIVIDDACGAGHDAAGERSLANIEFMGDAIRCKTDEIATLMRGGAK